jgi:hypothetical protein
MKLSAKSCLLFTSLLAGCNLSAINGGYKDIGGYSSRSEGQKQAINNILKNYGSLPKNGHYKVKYANRNSPPTEERENAIWYSRSESELIFEADVSSGPMCRWKEVSKAVLEQASKSANSLAAVDSLSKPEQPFRQCQ